MGTAVDTGATHHAQMASVRELSELTCAEAHERWSGEGSVDGKEPGHPPRLGPRATPSRATKPNNELTCIQSRATDGQLPEFQPVMGEMTIEMGLPTVHVVPAAGSGMTTVGEGVTSVNVPERATVLAVDDAVDALKKQCTEMFEYERPRLPGETAWVATLFELFSCARACWVLGENLV